VVGERPLLRLRDAVRVQQAHLGHAEPLGVGDHAGHPSSGAGQARDHRGHGVAVLVGAVQTLDDGGGRGQVLVCLVDGHQHARADLVGHRAEVHDERSRGEALGGLRRHVERSRTGLQGGQPPCEVGEATAGAELLDRVHQGADRRVRAIMAGLR